MAWRIWNYQGVIRNFLESEAEKKRPKSRDELEALHKSGRASEEDQKALYWSKRLGAGRAKTT